MAYSPDYRGFTPATAGAPAAVLDAGLRAYMLRVYNWMSSGLVLTGIVALAIAHVPVLTDAFFPLVEYQGRFVRVPGALSTIAMFVPLAFVMVLSFGVNRLSTTAVQALFWAFCAAMGASLSSIFLRFTGESIAVTFFVTAGAFAATSIYGYTTGRDLTRMGSFLFMGLIGIVLASLVNLFVGSSALQFAISVIGVLVFTGLTAYDTQRIKSDFVQYAYAEGSDVAKRRSAFDALSLYLNFINLFMLLLQLTGGRSNNN